MQKTNFLHILQYHNITVIILIAAVFILGATVFAQTDAGQEFIGQPEEKVISVDNKTLLEADLDNFDMGFEIAQIKEDKAAAALDDVISKYYIAYAYQDLILKDNVWQYVDKSKTIDISKRSLAGRDLGLYIAEELGEIAYWRKQELKEAQNKAKQIGPTEKEVVSEYSGLIGKVLDIKEAVFPGYEPVVKPELAVVVPEESEIASPSVPNNTDDLEEIYQDWVSENSELVEELDNKYDVESDDVEDDDVSLRGEAEAIPDTEDEIASSSAENPQTPRNDNQGLPERTLVPQEENQTATEDTDDPVQELSPEQQGEVGEIVEALNEGF